MKPTKGFTLIELVVVIVILGILAATALPKFVDLGKDARIGALNGLKGALESAAREGYAVCLTSSTCAPSGVTNYSTDNTNNTVVRDGITYRFHYGYPIGWGNGGFGGKGIESFVNYSGFTLLPYVSSSYQAVFTKDGAPKPEECKVIYDFPNKHAAGPLVVSVIDTGC